MIQPDRWAGPSGMAPDLINSIGLGQLVTVGATGEPQASSLAFEAVAKDGGPNELVFHIPRYFPQHADLAGSTALALFLGAQGYISPRWYEEPDAPTWDFESVEVRGIVEPLNPEETLQHLQSLTRRQEHGSEEPFSLDEVKDLNYLEAMLAAIEGFRMPMDDVRVRQKLSQNRTPAEIEGIRSGLLERRRPFDTYLSDVIGRHAENDV